MTTVRSRSVSFPVRQVGLCTPIGLNAPATRTALYAGIARFAETEVLDQSGEPVRASRLSLLDPGLSRTQRIEYLATRALADCLASIPNLAPDTRMLLALPNESSGAPVDRNTIIDALIRSLPPRARISSAEVHRSGRAAFFELIEKVSGQQSPSSRVLIGAADSLVDRESLELLARENMTLGARNIDGRIPGEGAGFALLELHANESRGKLIAFATSAGDQTPPHSVADDAAALTSTLREIGRFVKARTDRLLSGQPGEAHWATALSYACLRNADVIPEPLHIERSASSLGDTGVATGHVLLELALNDRRRHVTPPKPRTTSIIYGVADDRRVGGCIVESARCSYILGGADAKPKPSRA